MGESGEQRRFLDLVTAHRRILHRICNLYAEGPGDRQDLRQEILLQLWRSFPSFRGDAAITTWMYRVALNTALLRRRKRRPETPLPDRAEVAAPRDDPEREQEVTTLYACIRELPAVDRAIILLYLEEQSYDEIAGMMGLSRSNVSVRIVRAKRRLQECLVARGCHRE